MTIRVVYLGTPNFACPTLEALVNSADVSVELVVTQPDREAGRGRKLLAPPVKQLADRLGVNTYQTESLRTAEQRAPIAEAQPDLIVVAAFGLILGKSILELPPLGCLNLHASLLPKYRGAAPISAAIASGDVNTGVTLMQMERGLDSGPMLASSVINITSEDTTETLTDRLGEIAANLMLASLPKVIAGSLVPIDQPPGATLTRPLVKADGWIDWTLPATVIERHIRAMWSWPRAWTSLPHGESLQIHKASVVATTSDQINPGTIRMALGQLVVTCGEGALLIEIGQLPGGKPLAGHILARRPELNPETVLGGARPTTPWPLITAVID